MNKPPRTQQTLQIEQLLQARQSQASIARQFGISEARVWQIKMRMLESIRRQAGARIAADSAFMQPFSWRTLARLNILNGNFAVCFSHLSSVVWWKQMPAICTECSRLQFKVDTALAKLHELTSKQMMAFRFDNHTEFMRLDKEFLLLIEEKERAVGALAEHVSEHLCKQQSA